MTVTVAVDGYWTRAEPLKLSSRAAKVARRLRSRTPAKLYVYETLLQLLAQDIQDVAAEFRKFIQEKNAVVRPRAASTVPSQGGQGAVDNGQNAHIRFSLSQGVEAS